MKRFQVLLLSLFLCVLPSVCFAEISLSDLVDVDTSLLVELMPDMQTDIAYGYGPGPGPAPGYGPSYSPRPVVRHYNTAPTVVHHRTVVRRQVRPVVVVEQPATVVVEAQPAQTQAVTQVESQPVAERVGSRLGFGLRGVGMLQGPVTLSNAWVDQVESQMGGGIGLYIKYRPIRWVSVEFMSDLLFAKYRDEDGSVKNLIQGDLNYIRVPVSAGLQIHVFDYGSLDVYGVVAASVAFTTINDGNDDVDQDGRLLQFGGQFGAGVSVLAGALEIGIDVRYTIDQAPDEFGTRHSNVGVDHSKPVHGMIFALNFGLGF